MGNEHSNDLSGAIAIIGMSGRFPGARNLDQYWRNLRDGVESISFFNDEEMRAAGVDPALLADPRYVAARGIIDDVELFDAPLFDFSPREAEITDPQHRLFLECAWEALENSGYDSQSSEGPFGVYAGVGINNYIFHSLDSNREMVEAMGSFQTSIGNDKDYLTTRVSYKLNLNGPSVTIQTACSTSLVAVHLACQGLLSGECDVALAGGVSIRVPQKAGHLYQPDGILSPDGHCRAFDASAQGTTGGNGVGVVVLKRMADALADRDSIHAVIIGSAINNDGASKVGYTAPSIEGQAQVIKSAQAVAGIDPETITYIEAHGTGTPLGDPIEIAALTRAFRASTGKNCFCAVGSVKTNIGHLDAAAGAAGLIKTVLSLKHKTIPPSLHFKQANLKIDFNNSPFYVNAELKEWKSSGPRRAGVSSFGIGGTNAHLILQEAPAREPGSGSRPWNLLTLSAKTSTALETATKNLLEYLKNGGDAKLADIAYTYNVGRRLFPFRRALVCEDIADAIAALQSLDSSRVLTRKEEARQRAVVLMFPGQGSQYVNMGRGLYRNEESFRDQVDYCSKYLRAVLGIDIRELLYPRKGMEQGAREQLKQTKYAQPALFVTQYALAQMWLKWGVRPEGMIGHSIGEYTAGCVAGVMKLEDALKLVAERGRLMGNAERGAMLAVRLGEKDIEEFINDDLSLAAVNGPAQCVVSGETGEVERLEKELREAGVECRRLGTSHAFHSRMMEPLLQEFREQVEKVELKEPGIKYVSNVTGRWIKAEEAKDAEYWVKHLRGTVRFADGINELMSLNRPVMIEVGPGQGLTALAKRQIAVKRDGEAYSAMIEGRLDEEEVRATAETLGKLWQAGVGVDWKTYYEKEKRCRVALPTYPFERQRHWIDPKAQPDGSKQPRLLDSKKEIADWFYVPCWKQSLPAAFARSTELSSLEKRWLVFLDECGLGNRLAEKLRQAGRNVVTVTAAQQFEKISDSMLAINPGERSDYNALARELCASNKTPERIAHLWNVTQPEQSPQQDLSFYSLLFLAQALGEQDITHPIHIDIISSDLYDVTGEEMLCPEKATLLGPCKVIPQEYINITCRNIDVIYSETGNGREESLVDKLISELAASPSDPIVALRRKHRWAQSYEAVRLEDKARPVAAQLRQRGVYLITGGLGSMGLAFARYLAEQARARLILTGRAGLPPREEWESLLSTEKANGKGPEIQDKIRKIREMEGLGSEVLVFSADVSDFDQMQRVVSEASDRFGKIDGVIHTAGTLGQGLIHLKKREDAASVLAPKMKGAMVVDELLKGAGLDFFILCSSISSVMPLIGQADYCAANAFLDAFAHYRSSREEARTISIDWGYWQELGISENALMPAAFKRRLEEAASDKEMSKAGVTVFDRILSSCSAPQIIVSPDDIKSRGEWIKSLAVSAASDGQQGRALSSHPRPGLASDYAPPVNEVERKLAGIWQDLFGIEQIGIHDNFFELGGDSLLGLQTISRMREAFNVTLPLQSFFNAPTIAGISQELEKEQRSTREQKAPAIKPVPREAYRMKRSLIADAVSVKIPDNG